MIRGNTPVKIDEIQMHEGGGYKLGVWPEAIIKGKDQLRPDGTVEVGCYCCSCPRDEDDNMVGWDPACRNHGAHGVRACTRHDNPPWSCTCGCESPDGQLDGTPTVNPAIVLGGQDA